MTCFATRFGRIDQCAARPCVRGGVRVENGEEETDGRAPAL